MSHLLQDIRYSIRLLAKNPLFSFVAILSLALGIGANSAIFSLINALILRSLPVPEPQQLVAVSTTGRTAQDDGFSLPMLEELGRRQRVFSGMFGWWGGAAANLEINGVSYPGSINAVTGAHFSTLGVTPLLGRTITPDDVGLERGSPAKVAVLDYRCWRDRFQGDPAVLGKIVRVDGEPFTVIGVTRKEFAGLIVETVYDVTVPLTYRGSPDQLRARQQLWLDAMARLKEGVTIEQARAQLATVWPDLLAATVPADWRGEQRTQFLAQRLVVEPAATGTSYLRKRFSRQLAVLMGLVGVVLLIACVNLASLMLSRAVRRRHEVGIRVALGARRWPIVRQFLMESLLLSLSGAALGFFFAFWTSRMLAGMIWMGYIPLALDPTPDLRVLGFTAAVALVTGVLFGIAPAWRSANTDPAGFLRQNARTVRGGGGRFGKLLVSAQVALSLVVIVGAALFVRSLEKLRARDPGFRREGVLVIQLAPKRSGRNIPNRGVYYQELAARLSELPGVQSVSYSYMGPVVAFEWKEPVSVKSGSGTSVVAIADLLGPGFVRTIGMRLLAGRDFGWSDAEGAPRVALVSESLAQRLFPASDAVGQHVGMGTTQEHQDLEIVGVVNSASLWSLRRPEPVAIYLPWLQEPDYNTSRIDIRTSADPAAVSTSVRRALEAMDHHTLLRIETLEQRVNLGLLEERLLSMLSSFFGALALLLAAIGLYGLMSYAVTRRTAEIGIRMALGAQRESVIRLILRDVLWMILLGLGIGLPVALAATRLVSGLLFGLSPRDPAAILLATVILFAAGLLAGYLPARRASRIDPMSALRCE